LYECRKKVMLSVSGLVKIVVKYGGGFLFNTEEKFNETFVIVRIAENLTY